MSAVNKNIDVWKSWYIKKDVTKNYPNIYYISAIDSLLQCGKNSSVFEYGFGDGQNLLYLAQQGYAISGTEISSHCVDSVQEALKAMAVGSNVFLSSGKEMPLAAASVDAVLAIQVLYYNDWNSLHDAYMRLLRILKPGGLFIATMSAPGDISQKLGDAMGDSVYRSQVPGQEGALCLVLEKEQLFRAFPDRSLAIGKFMFSFGGKAGSHWLVAFVNNEGTDSLPVLLPPPSRALLEIPDDMFIRVTWWRFPDASGRRVLLDCQNPLPHLRYMRQRGFDVKAVVPDDFPEEGDAAALTGYLIRRSEVKNCGFVDVVISWHPAPTQKAAERLELLLPALRQGGRVLCTGHSETDSPREIDPRLTLRESGSFFFNFLDRHTAYWMAEYAYA